MNLPRKHLLTLAVAVILQLWCASAALCQPRQSRFPTADSRDDFVHRITLYDAQNNPIGPGKNTQPYSPSKTCGRCHDVEQIACGYHFSPDTKQENPGRPGEPWVWVDPTTGTQLPLSYRGWQGSLKPSDAGVSPWAFVLQFGSRTCGGYPTAVRERADKDSSDAATDKASSDRFRLSGPLEVDCLLCHARGSTYDMESWAMQIASENFAWAPTAAIGLATVDRAVKKMPDDFDPTAEGAEEKLPATHYKVSLFDHDGQVFFDIVRTPANNACYRCHSSFQIGQETPPAWTQEQDVHLAAGIQCVDCHPNGIEHNTVRGFSGEVHPQQQFTAGLTCSGCHLGAENAAATIALEGGRFGAPRPEHRGLPPIHLERLSCTACHAGPLPGERTGLVQTSRNHQLGHKAHRAFHQQPEIVEAVLMRDAEGVLSPYRVVWPSYWANRAGGKLERLDLQQAQEALQRVLRVRRDFVEEMMRVRLNRAQKAEVLGEERAGTPASKLTDEERGKLLEREQAEGARAFHDKLQKGLEQLRKAGLAADPVFVAGEKLYQLNAKGELEVAANPDPQPYAWAIGHDVRPARRALGAKGCTDCHTQENPFFSSEVIAEAPVPEDDLASRPTHEHARLDAELMNIWGQSFLARPLFKLALIGAIACVSGVVLIGGTAWLAAALARRGQRDG
jgi:hypothetical protein